MPNHAGERVLGRRRRLVLAAGSLVYAVAFCTGTGIIPAWGHWYSPSLHYRRQAEALLRGSLCISHSLADVEHDMVWHAGGVHQVWGLGVPLWRLPFEAIARLAGESHFPDRLCFLVALWGWAFLVVSVLLRTDPRSSGQPSRAMAARGILGVATVLLNPCFVSLCSTRFDVYEEACAYSYLCGTGMLLGVVHLGQRPSMRGLCAMALAAGMAPMVRPTLLFYGAASLAPCLLQARSLGLVAGLSDRCRVGLWYSLGLVVLLATNWLRFGAACEFGHSLNLQKLLGSMYATRFDHPFRDETMLGAAQELVGAIFGVRVLNGDGYYADGVLGWQSRIPRWREFYFSTFDPTWLVLWGLGIASGMAMRGRQASKGRKMPWAGGASWAGLGAAAMLCAFYLRTPVISSRYMADFAPAFGILSLVAAEAVALWLSSVRTGLGCLGVMMFMGWWGSRIAAIREVYGPPTALPRLILARKLASIPAWEEPVWPDEFRVGDANHLRRLAASGAGEAGGGLLGIQYNGIGWSSKTGETKPLVALFVKRPEFVEVEIASAHGAKSSDVADAWVRARLHLRALRQVSSEVLSDGFRRVRFAAGPDEKLNDYPIPLFIALGPPEGLGATNSPFLLRSVRVRGPSPRGDDVPKVP